MCYDHITLANFKGGDLGDNFDSKHDDFKSEK